MVRYFVDDNGHVQSYENGYSAFLKGGETAKADLTTLQIIRPDGEIVGEYCLWSSLRELAKVIEDRM